MTDSNDTRLHEAGIGSDGAQGCCRAHIELPTYLSCYFCRSLEAYVIILLPCQNTGFAACRVCLGEVAQQHKISGIIVHEMNRN